jgi:hypothetical protein
LNPVIIGVGDLYRDEPIMLPTGGHKPPIINPKQQLVTVPRWMRRGYILVRFPGLRTVGHPPTLKTASGNP